MIKTFRGLMATGAQDTIVLHTNKGEIGYRIVKFEMFTNTPGIGNEAEHLMKVFKIEQATVDSTVDFSDQTLLAAGFLPVKTSVFQQAVITTFDSEIFNQDIFITHIDNGGNSVPCNYYLELEQIKLDLSANTVATLKDIRNTAVP